MRHEIRSIPANRHSYNTNEQNKYYIFRYYIYQNILFGDTQTGTQSK
jgi:hypothetical protein